MARIFIRSYRLLVPSRDVHFAYFELSRCCSAIAKPQKESDTTDCASTTYVTTAKQYAYGKRGVAQQALQELLNIQSVTANDIVTRYNDFQSASANTISTNYKLLKQIGIEDSTLLEHPVILAQRDIDKKLEMLRKLNHVIKDTAPLLTLQISKLQLIIKRFLKNPIRLQRTANLLKASVGETCSFIVNRPFLISISMVKLENNLKLLTDFGIEAEELKSDFWVLQYSTTVITERLRMAKKLNIGKLKTWMVRSKREIFETIYENKDILKEDSLEEYLAKRLDCTTQQMKRILAKHPTLLNKSLKKINAVIDQLIGDGFTPQHIIRNSKILLHSIETTKKRLQELESLGMKVDSLHILTKSQKQYMQYYDNLVKSNKSKIEDIN